LHPKIFLKEYDLFYTLGLWDLYSFIKPLNIWCKLIWESCTLLNHISSIFESKISWENEKKNYSNNTYVKYSIKCYECENS